METIQAAFATRGCVVLILESGGQRQIKHHLPPLPAHLVGSERQDREPTVKRVTAHGERLAENRHYQRECELPDVTDNHGVRFKQSLESATDRIVHRYDLDGSLNAEYLLAFLEAGHDSAPVVDHLRRLGAYYRTWRYYGAELRWLHVDAWRIEPMPFGHPIPFERLASVTLPVSGESDGWQIPAPILSPAPIIGPTPAVYATLLLPAVMLPDDCLSPARDQHAAIARGIETIAYFLSRLALAIAEVQVVD